MYPNRNYVKIEDKPLDFYLTTLNLIESIGRKVNPDNSIGKVAAKIIDIIRVCCNDFVLCIDNIDGDIHFKNHALLWEMLIEASNAFNIQVFAVTHNLEMIKAFADASESLGIDSDCSYLKLTYHPKTRERMIIDWDMDTVRHALIYKGGEGLRE